MNKLLCALIGLILCVPTFAAEAENRLKNGDFSAGLEGWDHRTKSSGYVKPMNEEGKTFVRIGVNNAGEDSFIQQIVPLPEGTARVTIAVTFRYQDVVKGDKGYHGAKVQGRFVRNGKETGAWIDLAGVTGTSEGWVQKTRTAAVPKEGGAEAVMLRLAGYGLQSGHLDVASASITTETADDVAAATAAALMVNRQMQPYGQKPSDARFARLIKGVNVNNWFGQPYNMKVAGKKGGYNAEWFDTFITDADLKQLKAAGFTNIRLPIEVAQFMDTQTGELKTELLPELDKAIKRVVDAGLAVQVDFHPKEKTVDAFGSRPELKENFVKWVGHMSAHLAKTTDPEFVFIELLNEPGGLQLYGNTWQIYQDRLILEARKNAPEHTLITNAGGYMLWSDTIKHTPHPDRNVVFAVHYYEPSQFTHQGAIWMKDWYQPLRQVPWPCGPDELQAAIDRLDRSAKNKDNAAKAESVLKDMVAKNIGQRATMAENFQKVADWAKQHDVHVIVNEFGVYKHFADDESRKRWFNDMATELAKHNFGWTIWEYAHAFGIVSGEPGSRTFDPVVTDALGLKAVPPAAQ